MQQLFGVPIEHLALAVAVACAAIVGALLVAVGRRPVLWRLGLRNVPRRPGSSALIVAGLALGTSVVTSALFTGDTMTYTVRSLVADSLGRVDEVVVQSWLGPRGQNRRWFQALAQGAPLTAGSSYFDSAVHERLAAGLGRDSAIAALVPAIVEQVTLVDVTTQQLVPNTNVLGLPPDFPATLGALVGPSGEPLALAHLAPDGAYLNQEAATQLGAAPGDTLQLRLGDHTLVLRLDAIFATGDLGGARPTVVLPLATLQARLDHAGQINQMLVVNRGDRVASVDHSRAAARELRLLLVDDEAATRALAVLRTEPARRGLAALVADARGPGSARLAELYDALAGPDEPARVALRDALADPELAARVGIVATRLPQTPERGELFAALNAGGGMRVLELKRVAQERADYYASILTSIFVVLGLFSIATGLMLVFLVFVLLAAGRRAEMGVARALGARRHDLTAMLMTEGLVYALGAAALGVGLGIVIGHALVAVLQRSLEPLGLTVRAHVEPRSLAFAFGLGLLLSLVTIGLSAWWTSRLNIAAAMRNLAEPTGRAARWLTPALAVCLALVGAGLLYLGSRAQLVLPLALGLSALVVAGERALRWACEPRGARSARPSETETPRAGSPRYDRAAVSARGGGVAWRSSRAEGAVPVLARVGEGLRHAGATGASALLLIIWWDPRAAAQALGLGRAPLTPELFPVAGVAMTLAAVWGIATNLGALLAVGAWLVRPVRSLRLTGRLAAAHLGHQRFRAGMAMAMFALVLCSLTVSTVLLAGAHRAYGRPDAETAGYDLRAQAEAAPGADPRGMGGSSSGAARANGRVPAPGLLDLKTALVDAPAARPDDFPAIAAVTSQGGELIRLAGTRATWQATTVGVLDEEFLRTTAAHLSARAPGYTDARQVWTALAARPGLAVLGAPLAATLGLAPSSGALEASPTVWVRARDGGQAVRLQVIGVLGARSPLGDGVFVAEPTAERAGMPAARQVTYYLRTREGLTPERAASALNLSFGEQGLRASVVDPELRLSQAVQAPLSFLLQGFMGLGLVSGVLAVGLLAARAVLERRAQIGMLRAVGMRAGAVQFSLLLEGSAVALAGAGIGLAVGTALAGQVVRYLQRAHPEFPLVVPVDQLLAMAVLAWGASLLAAAVPAWQAGRIAPVDALRCE